MRNTLTIFKRELSAYFNSPIAYIFIIIFALLNASLFMSSFFLIAQASMRSFFDQLVIILCVFLPAVSMRLWSEDHRGNTIELLLTFPMKMHELVLGKYLASLMFFFLALLSTIPIPIMVMILGNPDVGVLASGYLGALMVGGFFLAIGTFISGFSKDQIVAFIISMMACFSFFLLGTVLMTSSLDGWLPGFGSFLTQALGATQHYYTFVRGVVDNRALLYFAGGSGIFLLLNGFWLEGKLRPKANTLFMLAVGISGAIFILFNVLLSDLPIGRFDWTDGKIYTISPSTGKILSGLDAPVNVKLYISRSEKMPTGLKTLERDITDKLDEFKTVSKGNFHYKVLHMETANVAGKGVGGEESLEQQLTRKGIAPFQVKSVQADEIGVSLVYSALSVGYKDRSDEIIRTVLPEQILELEYTLMSKIFKLQMAQAPKVALVAPYVKKENSSAGGLAALLGGALPKGSYWEDRYKMLTAGLQSEGYEVHRIELTQDEPIPDGVQTLIIVEPQELNDRQRFEINRFLTNGGSLFLAVQHYEFQYSHQPSGGVSASTNRKNPRINPLLETWGLKVDDHFLMDAQNEVIETVSDQQLFGLFQVSSPVRLPIQIRVNPNGMSQETAVTGRLPFLLYMWGTALEIDEAKLKENGLTHRVFLSSSPKSWTVPYHSGFLEQSDVSMPESGRLRSYPLAAWVEGSFPNTFEGRSVPEWPKPEESEGEEGEGMPDTQKASSGSEPFFEPAPGKLFLIGAASLFDEQFVRIGGSALFFLNAVDGLTFGEDLIQIRSKKPVNRFIQKPSTAGKLIWRMLTTIFVPVVLVVIGSLRLLSRRRSKMNYLRMLDEA